MFDYGNAVPDLLFTNAASTASMKPSTLASSRKLEPVTACPDWDLVWATSTASVKRSALVSPARTPIGIETLPMLVPSLTPVSVIAMFWALGTPLQLTVTTLPLALVVAGCPPQAAESTVTGPGNVTTMVWCPFGPPDRDSIPSGPLNGRSMSKSPTEPCVLRETAPIGATPVAEQKLFPETR